MKTLIVYFSFTRNNEILAKHLQRRLGCDVLKIEEEKKRTGFAILLDLIFRRKPAIRKHGLLLKNYDNFIFIAPIWAGKIAFPLQSFFVAERNNIGRYSFISLCGGRAGQKVKISQALSRLLKHPPEKVAELWINDLLPEKKKDTIKYTSGYRIREEELTAFEAQILDFLRMFKMPTYQA